MPDPDDIREAPSIAPAFSECLKLYRHLYFSLTGSDPRVLDQVDVPMVCDNYGRLNVWGSDSGALRTGRGSLDDLLRTNESLRFIVLDTISDLTESLKRATLLADVGINEEQLPAGDSDEDSLSSASTSSESFPDGGSRSRSKKGEIHYSFSDIFVHIQSLYKISVSLRRPAVHDKYIRSVSKDANASYFIPWDHTHVENKFRNASELLVRRLALANTRRRRQLKYWEKHPQDAAEGVLSEAALSDTATPQKKLAIGRLATESNPTQSLGIPSRATKQSFSTVAQSVINDHETFSGRPKTLYEPSLQGAGGYLRVPDRPAVPFGRTSFECPYCRTQLDVRTMRKRQLWKKHVFRDLRPYVCTYEGCLNAEKLYVTRHDWMYHEGQLHQRSWICGNRCNRKFPTPQLLKEHMLDCHLGTFAESQLPILIDMCERPADPDERAACPLCGMEATLRALRTHIASHLEDLALFVLPVETTDYNADANSHHAERPREKDNRLDDDELSSLGSFGEDEDGQAPLQDHKAFETALKKEGEYSLPEVGDWLSMGLEVRSEEEEEEREDTVQADLDTDIEANGRRKSERLALVEQQRIADAGENQHQIESIREEPETTESTSPIDHVSYLESETPLADLGRLAEAEKMYWRALKGKEKAGGPEHIFDEAIELAEAYQANGQAIKAIELLEPIVYPLTEDHTDRFTWQYKLAEAYQASGQYDEAKELLEHIDRQELADDHPDRISLQHKLAEAYQANGELDKAIQLFEHIVKINIKNLKEDHPTRLASQYMLADAYEANREPDKAIELLEHIVKINMKIRKEDHPVRLALQSSLVEAYEANGQDKKAIELLEHIVKAQEKLGQDHPVQLTSQYKLAESYQANGELDKAIELLEHINRLDNESLTEDHPTRLASRQLLAKVYQANGQFDEAVELLEREQVTKLIAEPLRLPPLNLLPLSTSTASKIAALHDATAAAKNKGTVTPPPKAGAKVLPTTT